MKVRKPNCVGDITSANNSSQSGNSRSVENFASLFGSKDKASAADASRIAHLEQLVGRLTVALDIEKKSREVVELTPSVKRKMVENVRNASSLFGSADL